MSNRADSQNQNADSVTDDEVIDLTEEVGDEIDDFALTMPEFKVPSAATNAIPHQDDDATGRLAPEDLEKMTALDASDESDESEFETREMEKKFDRSELVKTVQMDSFERPPEIMLGGPVPVELMLHDQRFAPDVLVRPPRVLTKKWQDGAKTAVNGAAPGGAVRLEDRQSIASTVHIEDGEKVSEALTAKALQVEAAALEAMDGMSEAEALDLDASDLFVEEVKPPSRPPHANKPPQAAKPPEKPPASRPTANRSDPVGITSHRRPETSDDDDLNGIVQELLEEKKQNEPVLTPEQKKRQLWCQEVFDEEYLRTLPKALKKETEREVKFIRDSLGLQKGARVLDLACGFGRHSVELAESGFEVAGLDLSMVLLQHALGEAQRRNLSIKFIHGDMRELNFPEIFDGCFCWQTSFGYFDDQTNLSVLSGIHSSLKPGGRLLLDLVNRDYVVAEMPSRTWWEGIECVFLEEVEFDYTTSVLHTKRSFIYEDGSPPREYSSYIRLYSLHELKDVLAEAGFTIREVSGATYHRSRFLGPTSAKMIVLAEKNR